MKKILLLICVFLFANFYQYSCYAADDDYEFGEEDFDDYTEDSGDEFYIFDPESESTNGTMYMTGTRLDGDLFKLSVMAKDMTTPVLGMAFHLTYENLKLAFLKYEPGDFLERGGDPFYLVENSEEDGEIVFGETLRRNDSFPVGEGVPVVLYFQILDGDKFDFGFKDGVISTIDTVRQDLDRISWEDFSFGKIPATETLANSGKADVLAVGKNPHISFWVIAAIFAASAPVAYLVIMFLKKQSELKKLSQENPN